MEQIKLEVTVTVGDSAKRIIKGIVGNILPGKFDEERLLRSVDDMIFYWLKNAIYDTGGDGWFTRFDGTDESEGQT